MTVPPFRAAPPGPLALAEHEVQVFRARLDVDEDRLEDFASVLDPGETARAARFRFPVHRARFVASHGLLRTLLGKYLGIGAGEVRFARSRYGKPSVEGSGLKFNMSHSEELALFAFARDREVGIDVEFRKPDFPALELARNVFTERERELLASGAVDFFRIWSCKEALAKAAGTGISKSFAGAGFFSGPSSVLLPGGLLPGSQWWLCELDAGPDCAAALAVWETPLAVRCYDPRATES